MSTTEQATYRLTAATVEANHGYFLRRARKAHRCRQCDAAIVVGAQHVEYLGGSPAYQSGPRYCCACMVKDGVIEVAA